MPDYPFSSAAVKSALIRTMDGPMGPMADEPKTAPEKKSHTGMHRALAVMGGGQAADAITTILALRNPRLEEGNAGVYGRHPSAARIALTKAGVMVPIAILLDKAHNEHPKLAKALAYLVGALGGGMAVHNAAQMGRR